MNKLPKIIIEQEPSFSNAPPDNPPLLTPEEMAADVQDDFGDDVYPSDIEETQDDIEDKPENVQRKIPAAPYNSLFGLMANKNKVVNTDGKISRDTYEEPEEPEIFDQEQLNYDDDQSDVDVEQLKSQLRHGKKKRAHTSTVKSPAARELPPLPDSWEGIEEDDMMPWDYQTDNNSSQRLEQMEQIETYNNKNAGMAKDQLLARLDHYKRIGHHIPKDYNYTHSRGELLSAVNRCETLASDSAKLKMAEGMIVTFTGGIELANGNINPYPLALDGWSASVAQNIKNFDQVLLECVDLVNSYIGGGKANPFIMLALMLGISGASYHFSAPPIESRGGNGVRPAQTGMGGIGSMLSSFGNMMGGMLGKSSAPAATTAPAPAPVPQQSEDYYTPPKNNENFNQQTSVRDQNVMGRFTDSMPEDQYIPVIRKNAAEELSKSLPEVTSEDFENDSDIDDLDDLDDLDDAEPEEINITVPKKGHKRR